MQPSLIWSIQQFLFIWFFPPKQILTTILPHKGNPKTLTNKGCTQYHISGQSYFQATLTLPKVPVSFIPQMGWKYLPLIRNVDLSTMDNDF